MRRTKAQRDAAKITPFNARFFWRRCAKCQDDVKHEQMWRCRIRAPRGHFYTQKLCSLCATTHAAALTWARSR